MTSEVSRHPDLLRRFVATPYVFAGRDDLRCVHVESNDLELALRVRSSEIIHREGKRAGGLFCKIVRDVAGPVNGSEISILSSGPLQVLYRGSGTIMIHDRERLELLGFLSPDVSTNELVSSLLPALFGRRIEEQKSSAAFTNK
jgi:hypothetical protein